MIPADVYLHSNSSGICNKILCKLKNPESSFSKEEFTTIIHVFNFVSFYRKAIEECSVEIPFSDDYVFSVVSLINQKIESLSDQGKEEVRLRNLLLAADLGEYDFFINQLFFHLEDMEEVINNLSINGSARILKILDKCGERGIYLVKDLVIKTFNKILEIIPRINDLGLDFEEVAERYFLVRFSCYIGTNEIVHRAILERAYAELEKRNDSIPIEVLTRSIFAKSKEPEQFVNNVTLNKLYPRALKEIIKLLYQKFVRDVENGKEFDFEIPDEIRDIPF